MALNKPHVLGMTGWINTYSNKASEKELCKVIFM